MTITACAYLPDGTMRTIEATRPGDLEARADAIGARRFILWGETYLRLFGEWVVWNLPRR